MAYTRIRMVRLGVLLVLCVLVLPGQQGEERNKLGLPNPDKLDVPYLIHGSRILELEQTEAMEDESKNQLRYWIPGSAAEVKTPLAAPEFLFDSSLIDPRDLRLYRFDVVKGRRELLYRKGKKVVAEPYFLQLDGVEGRVVRIRISASLAPGEYGLTPNRSNAVFAFAIF